MKVPYKHDFEQRITTDVEGVSIMRSFPVHYQISAEDAVAASNVGVHAAVTLGVEAQDVTTGITNPAVPRNLIVKGNASGIIGDVVITGTNFADEDITETITLNGSTAVEGNKAFKTVTKIALPAETHVGTDTVSVGWGDKMGLPYKLSHNTVLYKHTFLDNTVEATEPTVTVSATAIESNTIDLNTGLNGKVVDVYLLV